MAEIGVTEMAAPIPGILSWGRSSSDAKIKGLEGFWERIIFSLGLEPEAPSSLRIFWSLELSLFLFELNPDWVHDEVKNTLDHHSWKRWVNFLSEERHYQGTTPRVCPIAHTCLMKSKDDPWAWKNREIDVRRNVLVEALWGAIMHHNKTIFIVTTNVTWTKAGKVSKVRSWKLAIIDKDPLGLMSNSKIPAKNSIRTYELTCFIQLKWFSPTKATEFLAFLDWMKLYRQGHMSENSSLSKHKGSSMGYVLFFLDAQSDKFHPDLYKCSQGRLKKGNMFDLLSYSMLLKRSQDERNQHLWLEVWTTTTNMKEMLQEKSLYTRLWALLACQTIHEL